MKFIFHCRFLVGLIIGLAFGGGRAAAATTNFVGFSISTFNTGTPAFASGYVTNFITVSNLTGFNLSTVYVTNAYSGSVSFIAEYSDYTNDVTTNNVDVSGDTVLFSFNDVTNEAAIDLEIIWQPQAAGLFTNAIGVYAYGVTNTAGVSLVTPVYSGQADLGVNLAVVSQAYITNYWVITNDWASYLVTVTNLGPDTATGVLLTNALPPGAILVSPKNQTVVSNNWILNLGTLASGAGTQYRFTIQPTNAGAYSLIASVSATNLYDVNVANNLAVQFLSVTNYLATLSVGTNSGQSLNFQNGLIEQTIQATNISGTAAPAVRVVVTGLTNELFNASGTNAGHPFVTYPAALAAGNEARLRLQYFPHNLPFPFTNSQLTAYAVPASVLNYTPFAAIQYQTNLNISRIVEQADGDMLIEFPSVLGDSYTIVYSDNMLFSNAMIASPAYIAPANRVQWLDYGPPATVSAPTNSSQRFYRVYLNP